MQPDATLTCDPMGQSGQQAGLTPTSVNALSHPHADPPLLPSQSDSGGGCSAVGRGRAPVGAGAVALGCLLGAAGLARRGRKKDRAHRRA